MYGSQFSETRDLVGSSLSYGDGRVGRWLSRDPLGEAGGLNLFGYVGNNPIGRFDPLGLLTPVPISIGGGAVIVVNLPITFTSGGGANSAVPTYGNWGGPDYSGGLRPSLNGGQNGAGAPVDSLDALFKNHDLAYGKYGLTPSVPSTDCDSLPTPCEQEKCRQKRRADNDLYQGLMNLPNDQTQWAQPPAQAEALEAQLYRAGAEAYFKPTDWK